MPHTRRSRSTIALVSAVTVVALQLVVAAVHAATFTVTKTADSADGTCDSDCSLREAVIAANTAPGADTITVPAGTYVLTLTGPDENAAATGDLDISGDLTITGAGAGQTIVDGNQTDRVFDVVGDDLTVQLSELTVQHGKLTGSVNVDDDGAGIRLLGDNDLTLLNDVVRDNETDTGAAGGGVFLADSDTLTLDGTAIGTFGHGNTANRGAGIKGNGSNNEVSVTNGSGVSYNSASSSGGGIFMLGSGHHVTVDASEVSHNHAVSGDGGGIYYHAGSSGNQIIVRNGSRVNENGAGNRGGGIRALGATGLSISIEDSEVLANDGGTGGGLYVDNEQSTLALDGSRVAFNRASSDCGNGGGIFNGNTPPQAEESPEPDGFGLTVLGGSVDHNYAGCSGGGIYNTSESSMATVDTSIDHNIANDEGGGIFNETDGAVFLRDSALDLNAAVYEEGGGIYNDGILNVVDTSELVGNSAANGDGGAIFNGGVKNTASAFLGPSSEELGTAPVVVGNSADGAGGGIYNATGSQLLTNGAALFANVAVADHETEGGTPGGGGGVYNAGFYQLDQTIIGFNVAGDNVGGGLLNDVDAVVGGSANVVVGNYGSDGGGIFNASFPQAEGRGVSLNCTAIAANNGADGGGIANSGSFEMSPCFQPRFTRKQLRRHAHRELRLARHAMQAEEFDGPPLPEIDPGLFGRSLVASNNASGDGGGIWNGATMILSETTIDGNTAALGRGGGIFNSGPGVDEDPGLDVRQSTLSDNFAKQAGGGLFNAFKATAHFINDTISGNFTNGTGGGIDDESGFVATTDLIHVTVTENSAPLNNGGGLDASLGAPGDIRVASSIVANNLGGDCSSPVGITSEDYNLSSDPSCGFANAHDQQNTDPRLGPLADNGGSTETHLPAEDSPAVDTAEPGDPPPCFAGGEPIMRDQRGEIRPENMGGGENCDIGSVELQFSDVPPDQPKRGIRTFAAQTGPTYNVNTTSDHSPDGCDDFDAQDEGDCTLREAVLAANADGVDSTIMVPAGTYRLTLTGSGENAAATGDLDLTDDVTIQGEASGDAIETIVDGLQADRVFDVNPTGDTPPLPVVRLTHLWIENGDEFQGGGIKSSGDLTLDDSVVALNRADCRGGGIYSTGPLHLVNASGVIKNGVPGSECESSGGGIFSTGEAAFVAIQDESAVDLNNALVSAGGIYNRGTGAGVALTISSSEVLQNVLTAEPDDGCPGCFGGAAGIYNQSTATLNGATVGGNVTYAGSGGGIYNAGSESGTLDLTDESQVVLNVAAGSGGGIFAPSGSVTSLGGVDFVGNVGGGGGGIYNDGNLTSVETLYMMNTALHAPGGGIYNNRGGIASSQEDDLLFNHATTSANNDDSTAGGGGIQNDSDGNGVDIGEETAGLTVTGGTIVGNTTPAAPGAGIGNRGVAYVDDSLIGGNGASSSAGAGGAFNCFVLYVEDTTADGNLAAAAGGGGFVNREVCNRNRTLHVTNSTVSANAAADGGGGIENLVGTVDVLNSTLSGNFAGNGPGGGLSEVQTDTTHLHNATIAFNAARFPAGGGIGAGGGGEVTALNTLVGLNYGGDCGFGSQPTSEGHNLDSDGTCFDGPADETHPGTFLDPLLGPLADNGGPTETHALLDGSPAIDKTPDDEECPDTDQRHVTRPQGELCDIGAYERELVAPSPSPSASQSQPPSGGGGGPNTADLAVTKKAEPEPVASGGTLTYTIVVSNNGPVTATGVSTTDDLPSGVTFQSASPSQGSCDGTSTVKCNLGTIPNGGSATITIVVTVTATSGKVINSVAVEGSQPDPNPGNNRAQAESTLVSASPSPTEPPGAKCPGFEDDPRNQIVGTDGDDELVGTEGDDIICGLGGNDVLRGLGGNDLIIGDSGPAVHRPQILSATSSTNADLLRGGLGNDVEYGNEGHDRLRGGAGSDDLYGQLGRDSLGGNNDSDTLRGGRGRDHGRGGPAPDVLRGGRGNDYMAGNADNDVVRGGPGKDRLFGKRGNDKVIGGKGDDREDGGIGVDTCVEVEDFHVRCES